MARRGGLLCIDILVCLDVLSEVDSEHEDDTEDILSWDESAPEPNDVSDCYSEISASASPNPSCSGCSSVSFGNRQKHYHRQVLQWGEIDPMVLLT
jgi:hypothetical protein